MDDFISFDTLMIYKIDSNTFEDDMLREKAHEMDFYEMFFF